MNDKITYLINLRPITMDDFDSVFTWSQNEMFCQANEWPLNRTLDEVYAWWLNCVNNTADSFVRMGIELNGKLIGYTDLANITDDTAELGIAIGETTLWGKGIAVVAAKCMMEFASRNLGIKTFHAETHETNIRSRKLLQKLGFEEASRIGAELYLGEMNQLIQCRLHFMN